MPLTLSASQLSKTNCGRKFELAYINGLQRKQGTHSRNRVFGTAFHDALAGVLRLIAQDVPDTTRMIEVARTIAIQSVIENTEEDKRTYDGMLDTEYYDTMNLVKHEVGVLLEWFIPQSGLGVRYFPTTVHDVFGTQTDDDDDTLIIEYEFDYAVTDNVNLRGYVDCVLYDNQTEDYIIVDWKTRSSIGSVDEAMLDAQLQLYAYAMQQMGASIDKVRMWEVRSVPPMPAKINKNGKPSVAMSAPATVRDVWLGSLTDEQRSKFGNDDFMDTVGSIKPIEYFIRETEELVTSAMLELTFANVLAQARQIEYWHKSYEDGNPLPALLNGWGCRGCDFLRLCSQPFHFGFSADDIIAEDYEYKDGYEPETEK